MDPSIEDDHSDIIVVLNSHSYNVLLLFPKKAMIYRDYFKLILTQATLSKLFLLRTLQTSMEPNLRKMKEEVTELSPPQITSNSDQSSCGGRVGGWEWGGVGFDSKWLRGLQRCRPHRKCNFLSFQFWMLIWMMWSLSSCSWENILVFGHLCKYCRRKWNTLQVKNRKLISIILSL